MSTHSPKTSRRSSRRALRRRQVTSKVAWVVSGALVLSAFGGGLLWHSNKVNRAAAQVVAPQISPDLRASALLSLDEAVKARHEERMDEAMAKLASAQQADPHLPGLELLAGEIALERRDTDALRRASHNALQRGDNEASAKLLAALEVWLRRGEMGLDRAAPQARQLLLEAAGIGPSDASIHFFHGELSRQLGDGLAAYAHLLSALRRQSPWRSSAMLRVKMQLAADEAVAAGAAVKVPALDSQSAAALRWREALRAGTGAEDALGAMIALTPRLQIIVLLDDAALQTQLNAAKIEALRGQLGNAITPSGAASRASP